jgi:tetratricopeptide (TPR) repeat protein
MAALPSYHKLPQYQETWHLGIRELKLGLPTDPDGLAYPVMILLNWDTRNVQAFEVYAGDPKNQDALEFVQNTISKPSEDLSLPPHRPKFLLIEDEKLVATLQPALKKIGIQVQLTDRLDIIDEIVSAMEQEVRATLIDIPGLLTGKGVSADLVGDVFEAAAEFYRARPWETLADNQPLKVNILPRGWKRYLLILGQGGIEFGIVHHKRIEDFASIFSSLDPLSEIPSDGWHTFFFEPREELPGADLDAIQQNKWPVADDEGFPLPVTYLKTKVKRPDHSELRFYSAILRAIPIFIQNHLTPDGEGGFLPVEVELEVNTQAGPIRVGIAYQPGEFLADTIFLDSNEKQEDDVLFEDEVYPDEPFADFAYFDDAWEAISQSEKTTDPDQASSDDPALLEAQDLVEEAYRLTSPRRRIGLAREALAISPKCAAAYILLAEEEAKTIEEAHEYYRQGVAAGEAALGAEFFELHRGDFWTYPMAHPYLQAMLELANLEWELEQTQEALQHYQELLALNPFDHYGVRYSLLNLLLNLGRDADALALIERYTKDPFADWVYSRALLLFHEQGDSPSAREALRVAIMRNPSVPAYLTGKKRLPKRIPDSIGLGDESEALNYVSGSLSLWRQTPGALPWLQKLSQLDV